jgi:maltooligosyltrehalose trehalohydrolase
MQTAPVSDQAEAGTKWKPFFGGLWQGHAAQFRVWAPKASKVDFVLHPGGAERRFSMRKDSAGIFKLRLSEARPGDLYAFSVDEHSPWPDPASRFQPQGVHGPSQLVDPGSFEWSDRRWHGVERERLVIYELHVGAFTREGTFAALSGKLAYLRELGVTAIELMPVADFPGCRNWGYDGAALFAPARGYGSPDDLRRLVDRAHTTGLGVLLDVVYNHLGPDGSYLAAFSPFFHSSRHQSPWGPGLNFDGPRSEWVRRFFIDNALHWIHEYHFDGLRLDATHAIVDDSPKHFLAQLSEAVESSVHQRRVLLIAEDDRNEARIATPRAAGGWGLDAVWADDFHHEVHRCLTGEGDGYFADFSGSTAEIAATARQGWFYSGQTAPSFGKKRGSDPAELPFPAFVTCLQNHDQVGNRAMGERLDHLVEPAAYEAASVLLLLLPETPLLFMGQEWASASPFQYFTDHNTELGRQVTEGRRREFARFASFANSAVRARIPDPQDASTFERSRLDWENSGKHPHAGALRLYRRLLGLRASHPAMQNPSREGFDILASGKDGLVLARHSGANWILGILQLRGGGVHEIDQPTLALPPGAHWGVVLTTEDAELNPDPTPVKIDLESCRVEFLRPGAVVFEGSDSR